MKYLKYILAITALSLSCFVQAHTQSPGYIVDDWVYKEVNAYEFTLVNRNKFTAKYDVLVGDYNFDTEQGENLKRVGSIHDLQYNEAAKFNVDFRVAPATTRHAVMCTQLANEDISYRSRVCSMVKLTRK